MRDVHFVPGQSASAQRVYFIEAGESRSCVCCGPAALGSPVCHKAEQASNDLPGSLLRFSA
jgi:hypothetical protein